MSQKLQVIRLHKTTSSLCHVASLCQFVIFSGLKPSQVVLPQSILGNITHCFTTDGIKAVDHFVQNCPSRGHMDHFMEFYLFV